MGQSATFSVDATSSHAMQFAWLKDGVPLADGGNISGSHSASVTIAPLTIWDFGTYTCQISVDECITEASGRASALTAPTIVEQPLVTNVCLRAPLALHVGATGNSQLRYQWRRNGVLLSDGPRWSGTQTPDLFIPDLLIDDLGTFDVLVGDDDCGSLASQPVHVTRDPSPELIVTQPGTSTTCPGETVVITVVAAHPAQASYRWLRDGQPLVDDGRITGTATPALTIAPSERDDYLHTYAVEVFDMCAYATSVSITIPSECLGRSGRAHRGFRIAVLVRRL